MPIDSGFQKHWYQLITFDVYPALFDIESSLEPIISGIFGTEFNSLAFVRDRRRRQLEFALISNSLQKKRIPFAEIGVLGTKSAGLHCVWSNRKQEPHPDPAPQVAEAMTP